MINKNIKLALFGVLLFGLSIFSLNLSNIIITKENIYNNNITNQLTSAGFWNLTGSPISIDDNDPSKNWSYTASHYDWCSGSGNWTAPYIIENVTISGQDSGNCIEIKNSDTYFIIRNCSLYNSGSSSYAGIKLDNVDNGKIINNNCSNNIYYGIFFDECNNNTLSGNTASNNIRGIYLSDSDKNTLSGNTVCNNSLGIYLWYSDNNTLSGNTACNNSLGINLWYSDNNPLSGNIASNNNNDGISISGGYNNPLSGNIASNNYNDGIYISGGYNNPLSGNTVNNNFRGIYLYNSNNNPLSGNTASNNSFGISLYNSDKNTLSGNTASNNINDGIYLSDSDKNTLSGNTASNNSLGIYLYYSDNNTLSGNTVSNNNYGIYIYSNVYTERKSMYNLFFNNSFLNNIMNAYYEGIDNYWYNGTLGNYWDDYGGVDDDDDGIGDTPYYITGSVGNQDNYPIWWDTIVINIYSPNSIESFGITAPNFTILTSRGFAHTTWYTIDNSLTNITFTGLTGTVNQTLWDALPEGNVTIRFYANDTLGRIGFQEVTVTKTIPQSPLPGIPGFDILFLVGIISVMVVIIIKKRVNHLN